MSDRFIRADQVEPEDVKWLWKELIPESMLTVIAGQPNQGKGTMAAHIAADVSQFAAVIYSAAEDSHSLMTAPRLIAAGAHMANVHLDRLKLPRDFELIEQKVVKEGVKLIVLDPLNSHLSDGVSRHSDSIRRVTDPLTEMAERHHFGVIVIDHALKRVAAGSNPLTAIGGSGSGLSAACRMGFLFGVNPDDPDQRILAPVKSNIRDEPSSLVFETDRVDIEGLRRPMIYLVEAGELEEFDAIRLVSRKKDDDAAVGRPAAKRHACQEWLGQYLAENGPTLAVDINEAAKGHGITARTLRRAAQDMGVEKDGSGAQCVWSLPSLSESDVNGLLGGGE